MKYYKVITTSILLSMSFVLQGQTELTAVNVQDTDSFADIQDGSMESPSMDRRASFYTGDHSLVEYISTHFEYPKIAKENCLEGTSVVRFKVSADGKIVDPQIIQSIHSFIDTEIIELINSMPNWNPRVYRGRSIPSIVELPFEYSLR